MSRAKEIITKNEAMVKGDKVKLDTLGTGSTGYHLIKGMVDKKYSFEYDADKGVGNIFFKNLPTMKFTTGDEGALLDNYGKPVNLHGALTVLTVIAKYIELDNFISKAK